jgi:hypothetical protein
MVVMQQNTFMWTDTCPQAQINPAFSVNSMEGLGGGGGDEWYIAATATGKTPLFHDNCVCV